MRVLVAYGTRPERIKMEPVINALRERGVTVVEWFSGQSPDLVPGKARRWDGLQDGISTILTTLEPKEFDAVLVQGDTATAYGVALAAFLAKVPVGHIEAGLRTYASEPWPEEAFRRMIAPMARWHFAADVESAENVAAEIGRAARGMLNEAGLAAKGIFITGNPVIDTLPPARPAILVTLHRRENWGARILDALRTLQEAASHPSRPIVTVITHPNWKAWMPEGKLDDFDSLYFDAPMPQERFRAAIRLADIIVTDSGGLQEEAAYYGKQCLVLRTSTERTALERSGAIQLVSPDQPEALRGALQSLLDRRTAYGTGKAGAAIADILCRELGA